MKLEAFEIIIERGKILDDLTLDFNDGRGPVGFASMAPAFKAHILAAVPPKERVTFTPVHVTGMGIEYEITRETIRG